VGEALLAPTRLYARHVAAMIKDVDVRAMSHVTGGGIPGNLPRVLPEGLGVRIGARWPCPPIFELVQRGGGISEREMRRTFNGGMGFLFVVDARQADRARATLGALGEAPVTLGEVIRVPSDRAFEERVEWPE
jgi:phosphoribosylformylglycinamidine cyclo-ligase